VPCFVVQKFQKRMRTYGKLTSLFSSPLLFPLLVSQVSWDKNQIFLFNFLLKYSSRVSLRVLTYSLSFWCCFFPIFTNFNNRLDAFSLLNHKHVCALGQTYQLKSRFCSCKTTDNFLSTHVRCCVKYCDLQTSNETKFKNKLVPYVFLFAQFGLPRQERKENVWETIVRFRPSTRRFFQGRRKIKTLW